jgi:hypothetical protein
MATLKLITALSSAIVLTVASATNLPVISITFNFLMVNKICLAFPFSVRPAPDSYFPKDKNGKKESQKSGREPEREKYKSRRVAVPGSA